MSISSPQRSGLALVLVAVAVMAAILSSYTQSASGASGGLTLDGSGFNGEQRSSTRLTVSLTTANPNDVILLFVETVGSQAGCYSIISVGDSAGLTWYTRGGQACFFYSTYNVYYSVNEYWAISTGVLASDIVSAITSVLGGNGAIFAYAIHGASLAAPFDNNDGLPSSSTLSFATVSTNNPDDLIVGIQYEPDPYGNYGCGSGFMCVVQDYGINWASEYTIVSAPQSSLAMTYLAPASSTIVAVADAICAAGGTDCVTSTSLAPSTTSTTTSTACSTGGNSVTCSTQASNSTSSSTAAQSYSSGSTSALQSSTGSSSFTSPSRTSNTSLTSPILRSVAIVLVAIVAIAVITILVRRGRSDRI